MPLAVPQNASRSLTWKAAPASPDEARARFAALKQQLGVPLARLETTPAADAPAGTPGLNGFYQAMGGQLPRGALVECLAPAHTTGAQTLLYALLAAARQVPHYVALVDACDRFDPASGEVAAWPHLLWVRCTEGRQVMPALDLLLRDENFPLVLLDARRDGAAGRLQPPATAWYRLQRLAHQHGTTLLTFAEAPLMSGVAVRVELTHTATADDFTRPRDEFFATTTWRPAASHRHLATPTRATPAEPVRQAV